MTYIEILDSVGKYSGYAVSTFVFAGCGAYLGSYLRKKGESKAIHEDISKIVDQMRAVTQVTKEIEAKISDDVWTRQRKWELRRDILLQTMDELTNTQGPLAGLAAAAFSLEDASDEERKANAIARMNTASDALGAAMPDLMKAMYRVQLVCGPDVQRHLVKVQVLMFQVHHLIAAGSVTDAIRMTADIGHATEEAQAAIRHELGMDEQNPMITPRSDGSWTAPKSNSPNPATNA
jgi:hypothetical protein